MKKIVVASNNEHKIKEIKEILNVLNLDVISMKEAGIEIEVEEDGKTFLENSYKKAHEISEVLKEKGDYWVLADDSGLMVDALDGAPGVFSARFAGEHGNSKKNNNKLLELLKEKDFEDRKAKFVCAMVLIMDNGKCIKVQGEVKGYITENERGQDGFGYDPLFYIPSFKKTFAEIKPEEKNKISHRAEALKMLKEEIKNVQVEE